MSGFLLEDVRNNLTTISDSELGCDSGAVISRGVNTTFFSLARCFVYQCDFDKMRLLWAFFAVLAIRISPVLCFRINLTGHKDYELPRFWTSTGFCPGAIQVIVFCESLLCYTVIGYVTYVKRKVSIRTISCLL